MTRTSENDDSHFLDHPEVLELFRQLFNNVLAESDRGTVLVGTSYVDLHLRKLFEAIAPRELSQKRLRAILDYPGPLSTFAARTQVAFLCRLINGSVYSAIEALREIRNSVAHKPDEFVLADHKEKLQRIYSLGRGVPVWVNRLACELLGRTFLERAVEIRLPDSEYPIFSSPADVINYITDKPGLLAPLNERLPRGELGIGILLICALIIHSREAAVRACGVSSTWPKFGSAEQGLAPDEHNDARG
jgi:hypothetical protein